MTELFMIGCMVFVGLIYLFLTRPLIHKEKTFAPPPAEIDPKGKTRLFEVDKEEFPFESKWFERDGITMHYVDEGEGIPVLLCHGNPDWSFLYRHIIKMLSGECRLIAYDLPGFGHSRTPKNYGFTPQEHAEWIRALVFDHLKLKEFIIVVGDWGGPTGLHVATTNPDSVLGAVITNTTAFRATGIVKWFSLISRLPFIQRLYINRNFVIEGIMQQMLGEKAKKSKAAFNAYTRRHPTPDSRKGPAEFTSQNTIAGDWLEDLEGRLFTLSKKPIEFIFGLKDPILGSEKNRSKWLSHFPHANVQEVPEAGHFTQEDSPESFAIAIRRMLATIQKSKNSYNNKREM